jgi:hypothetical protein
VLLSRQNTGVHDTVEGILILLTAPSLGGVFA